MDAAERRSVFGLPPRHLDREWLDDLSVHDPRARKARRDLRRVNAWMRQAPILRRLLLSHWAGAPPRSMLDLGGGDGTFLLRLARIIGPTWPDLRVTLVDTREGVSERTHRGLASVGWGLTVVDADVLDAVGRVGLQPFDVTVTNLFLHHLETAAVSELFGRISALTTLFVACEPRRSPTALLASHLLWVIGCNDVTRHDAPLSVRSGFLGGELSALWPKVGRWKIEEAEAGLFSHSFAARKRERG